MQLELEHLLEEFERLTLDERAFFQFLNGEDIDVCIQFKKNEARSWSVWYPFNEAASKQVVSRKNLPLVLRAFEVNVPAFVNELSALLLTQAAYADELVREISGLLGEDSVRRAIYDTQRFMEELRNAITAVQEPGDAPDKGIENPESHSVCHAPANASDSESAPRPRLRIVPKS